MITIIISTVFTIVFCGYLWLQRQYQYWENRRVPYLKADSLLFGNHYDAVVGKLSAPENFQKLYDALAPHRFGGIYNFYQPVLLVRDPELIKDMMIKDFRHFHDRTVNGPTNEKDDPLMLHLFHMVGEKWKLLRQKLSPAFTTGKMKMMFGLMKESTQKLEEIVEKCALDGSGATDVKDLMARYTNDTICSIAFGLEADSLRNRNEELLKRGREIFSPTRMQQLKFAFITLCPTLARFLGATTFSKSTTDFFVNLVSETIKYRRKNGIVRNDFLNQLMNVEKESAEETKDLNFTIELLTAQCFTFYLAGFETSSNTLSFTLYELAQHRDVQEKLQEEVDHVLRKYDGQITYDSVQEMRFMDKVFDETMRLYTSVSHHLRVCTENYRIPDSDFIVKRGETVFIPLHGLHRDPKYYPNPDTFNPENFSEEAKLSRPTCSFLPFGDGPRNCLGMRFAVIQVKVALTAIIRRYEVTLSPQMKLPLKFMPYNILTTPKDPILLNFRKRNTDTIQMSQ